MSDKLDGVSAVLRDAAERLRRIEHPDTDLLADWFVYESAAAKDAEHQADVASNAVQAGIFPAYRPSTRFAYDIAQVYDANFFAEAALGEGTANG